jgi:HSP20 family protein
MRARDDDLMRDIRHLQETMEQLLSDFSRLRMPLLLSKESVWRPLTDVYETDTEFVVRMEIPGMKPEDFKVTLEGHMVILTGVRRDPIPAGKKHFHKMEITLGPFERSVEIPPDFRVASVEAHYRNGFLIIRVTRGSEDLAERERIIPVERGS